MRDFSWYIKDIIAIQRMHGMESVMSPCMFCYHQLYENCLCRKQHFSHDLFLPSYPLN